MIFLFAFQDGVFSQLLCAKWLVRGGGEISFSVQLFHQFFITWQARDSRFQNWRPGTGFIIYIIYILALSYTVWRWHESPFRKLIRKRLV